MIYATLNGKELLGRSSISWSLAYGIAPQTTVIEVLKDQVGDFLKTPGFPDGLRTRERRDVAPGTLELRDSNFPERDVIVKNLFVISVGPGDGLNTSAVVLADRRWLASRTVVRRRYNIRRATGDRRLVGAEGLVPVQLGVSAPDFAFVRGSLKDGRPWTAGEVLEDMLEEIFGFGNWRIDEIPGLADDIESLELLDRGDEALARISALIPGLEFFVDYDGLVVATSSHSRRDAELVGMLSDEKLTDRISGEIVLAERDTVLPQSFRVYFLARTELRFDYQEVSALDEMEAHVPGREPLNLENVVINPIAELTLPSGKVAHSGEAVPVNAYLGALNLLLDEDGLTRPAITQADLRRKWLDGWNAWSSLYVLSAGGSRRKKWVKLLAALRSDWRQTFRILPQWLDKIAGLRAQRVGILDAETGTRAKATVHTQYVVQPSQLALNPQLGGRTSFVVYDWSEDLIASGGVSPFEVNMIDSDQGLFRLAPKTDEEGLGLNYILGQVDDANLPSEDMRDAVIAWGHVALKEEFKLAVVLSAQKVEPSGISSMHCEEISLLEASEALGVDVFDAKGPLYEIFALEDEARFAWLDDEADQIREGYYSGGEIPYRLLVNQDAMIQIARAQAARRLATLLPRYTGSITCVMRALEPVGAIKSITHTITPGQGTKALTRVTASGTYTTPSVWSQLPEGLRRALRGQVDRRDQ